MPDFTKWHKWIGDTLQKEVLSQIFSSKKKPSEGLIGFDKVKKNVPSAK